MKSRNTPDVSYFALVILSTARDNICEMSCVEVEAAPIQNNNIHRPLKGYSTSCKRTWKFCKTIAAFINLKYTNISQF